MQDSGINITMEEIEHAVSILGEDNLVLYYQINPKDENTYMHYFEDSFRYFPSNFDNISLTVKKLPRDLLIF